MKFAIYTAVLFLALGATAASAYAQQEKGKEARPQQARPAQQQHQAKPAQQQQPQAKAGERQHTQAARPAQQHQQQASRPQQSQARAQQPQHAGGNRGGYAHGRISDARYSASFGSAHSFHVNRGDYDNRRFQYGGYSFGFVDPWPVAWGYSDDVYVVYADGGYYMYDRFHPGLRISVSIF